MQHALEPDRLESLRSYALLDSGREPEFDDAVALAAQLCGTPLALLHVVEADTLFVKALHGRVDPPDLRHGTPCDQVVSSSAPVVLSDTWEWPGFDLRDTAGRPVRAYAGVPVVPRDGLPVASLCVLDVRPRRWTGQQVAALTALAAQVARQLELRRYDVGAGHTVGRPGGAPARLRGALDAGQLVPHYQPVVRLDSGQPLALEALLRWHRPDGTVLPPSAFLPEIASSGLIRPVGRHVLHRALCTLGRLRDQALVDPSFLVAVNVSLAQLTEPGLADVVLTELAAHGLPPTALSLEVTESSALLDDRCARRELHQLREAGVYLAVDDYGTGYSSIMRVLDLPFTAIKLDRGLVARLDDPRALAVTRSTLALAVDLGLAVVAEGIETVEQHEVLAELGCPFGQGYLFGRPVAPEAVGAVLAPWRAGPATAPERRAVVRCAVRPGTHRVAICADDRDVAAALTAHLLPGLRRGQPAAVVLTPERARLLAAALTSAGVDLREERLAGRYVELDADRTLDALLEDGRPSPARFTATVAASVSALVMEHGPVLLVDEMAVQLWRRGDAVAAAGLEALWAELGESHAFDLLCAWPADLRSHAVPQQRRTPSDQPPAPARRHGRLVR